MGASGLGRRYTRTPHTLGRGQGKKTRPEVGPRNVGVQSSKNSGKRGISHFWHVGVTRRLTVQVKSQAERRVVKYEDCEVQTRSKHRIWKP